MKILFLVENSGVAVTYTNNLGRDFQPENGLGLMLTLFMPACRNVRIIKLLCFSTPFLRGNVRVAPSRPEAKLRLVTVVF